MSLTLPEIVPLSQPANKHFFIHFAMEESERKLSSSLTPARNIKLVIRFCHTPNIASMEKQVSAAFTLNFSSTLLALVLLCKRSSLHELRSQFNLMTVIIV